MPLTKKKEKEPEEASYDFSQVDPLGVNVRLYRQISKVLTDLESPDQHITLKERIAALIAIGRIQVLFVNLRKEKIGDPSIAGSKVRKYATSFKAHDARGRKAIAGPAAEPEPSELDDLFADDDADDAS